MTKPPLTAENTGVFLPEHGVRDRPGERRLKWGGFSALLAEWWQVARSQVETEGMSFTHMSYAALSLAQANLMEHVNSHPLFEVGRLYVTNHILMMLVAGALMVLIFSHVGSKARNPVPSGVANFFEAMLSFLRTEVFRPVLGEHTDRFLPFLWTVFFFILFCNLLGLLPIGAVLGLADPHLVTWGGTATGNISVTAALAGCAFIAIHYSGIAQSVRIQMNPALAPHHGEHDAAHGHGTHHEAVGKPLPQALVWGTALYVWNYAPHPDMGFPILSVAMWVVLLALEMLGTFIKPFALCVRLFANMLAGHLVLGALVGLVPLTAGLAWMLGISVPVVLGSVAVSLLEMFECFLQAYIFTFLTTLFIASAVAPEH